MSTSWTASRLLQFSLLVYLCSSVTTNTDGPQAGTGSLVAVEGGTDSVSNATTERPPHRLVLLYGLSATTICNAAALVGFVFVPLHKAPWYPLLISFMVATAVGSLFTAAVLVLIPEAFELHSFADTDGRNSSHWYLLQSVSICVGSLLFFILEFLLRVLRTSLEVRSRDPRVLSRVSVRKRLSSLVITSDDRLHRSFAGQCDADTALSSPVLNSNGCNNLTASSLKPIDVEMPTIPEVEDEAVSPETRRSITCCTRNVFHRLATLDPLVWMIVLGDGMHNFMDGVSIAAGFSTDVRLGLSVSLAVLCEELPHELGDIAVLLRSGLSVPMAILFNFSSACTAYLGFFVGLYLGEISNAAVYIFAITGGFFLYISLADMLPDLRKSEDTCMEQGNSVFPLFVIHLAGILFGFGCVATITLTADYISL